MNKIKLSYFDFDGGRGEPTRIVMSVAGIDFEDDRISFPGFMKMRETTPLNAVPVLNIEGVAYTQSDAMSRYFGKTCSLYPADPWQAFLCDEAMGIIDDVMVNTVRTFGLEGEALESAREELVDGIFTRGLKLLTVRLAAAGGEYFADGQLTVADLKIFIWIRSLKSGVLDHVPTDLVDRIAPQLLKHMDRVATDSRVVEYYEGRKKMDA